MAYTPINWAENLDVTAVKLDKMDSQIDVNENDIDNIKNGTTTVAQADNASLLNGEKIEIVTEGSFAGTGNNKIIQLLNSNFHKKYFWSVYSPQGEISQGTDAYIIFGKQGENDKLVINTLSGNNYYYKAWALR